MNLEQYTNLNKDSFCYALEHKTDELGRISGIGNGGSYKFGIYRFVNPPKSTSKKYKHDNKYAWVSSLGNSAEEAFGKVRNAVCTIAQYSRKQYFNKIDTVEDLPPMIRWKIAFLYSEERLLPVYDRAKMLIPIAAHFGANDPQNMSHWDLMEFILRQKGSKPLYEFYEELLNILSQYSWKDAIIKVFQDEGKPLHYKKISDLILQRGYRKKAGDTPEMTVSSTLTSNKSTFISFGNGVYGLPSMESPSDDNSDCKLQYWWLVASPKIFSLAKLPVGQEQDYSVYTENGNPRRMPQAFIDAKVGDVVIGYDANPTKKIVALCEVSKASDGKEIVFKKTRSLSDPIPYSSIKENPALSGMEFLKNRNGTLFRLSKEEYDELMDMIVEQNPILDVSSVEKYDKERFLSEVYMPSKEYDRLVYQLRTKKNIILQGAPGVGKTFSAKRLAYSIIGKVDESRITMVQFHQNYSYEDFVLGYKPTEDGGFELREGIFYRACRQAQNDPGNDYFFLIDEINRGNMSKIFGELLMLIENAYRETEIQLAYNGESFSVPKNLYIIGMMNTADRSLAMIDYALRRRFSFFDMRPEFDSDGFKDYQKSLSSELFDRIIDAIKSLNKTIESDSTLGKGFCIGHSYFCNQKVFDKVWLQNVIDFDVTPMLSEYWFDDMDKADQEINKLSSIFKQ